MKQKKCVRKLNKVSSNRGAALITIIIVMTVVSILGFLGLSVSYSNFRMKNVDQRATENFYGAEKVLEEICVELQEDISEVYMDTYTEVLTAYDTYDTSDELQNAYEEKFYEEMTDRLEGANQGYYDIGVIQALIGDKYVDSDAEVTIDRVSGKEFLDKGVGGIFIRNLIVTYKEDGYADKITTDIKISAPSIALEKLQSIPSELVGYALVAGEGIEVLGKTNNRISGKVFAGLLSSDNNANIIARQGEKLSMLIPDEAKVTMDNGTSAEVITEGGILVENSSAFTANENTVLWTESVTADGGTTDAYNEVSLLGKTYMKDDTTLNGRGNTLTLGGQYYGYSGSTKSAKDSSAIIINGAETDLDMEELDKLVISGTSFVGTKNEFYADEASGVHTTIDDVMMGDSIAVKSNQLVYMVPTECEGIVTNPMTYEQYDALTNSSDAWEYLALNTYIRGLGRTIASYGNVSITPVFTSRLGGAVYLYLEFSSTEASSQYFVDNYGRTENGTKAEQYLENFVDAFQFNDSSMNLLRTAGNYLIEDGDAAKYTGATDNLKDMNLGDAYEKLCEENQFENIIDTYELRKLTGAGGTFARTIEEKEARPGQQKQKIQIVVADGDYRITESFQGVIIAAGDVEVVGGENMTITGAILCQGKLHVFGTGINLEADQAVTAQALKIDNGEGASAMNILVGNSGVPSVKEEKNDETIDIRNCITFENWKAE